MSLPLFLIYFFHGFQLNFPLVGSFLIMVVVLVTAEEHLNFKLEPMFVQVRVSLLEMGFGLILLWFTHQFVLSFNCWKFLFYLLLRCSRQNNFPLKV